MGRFRRIVLSSCLLLACSKSAPSESAAPAPAAAPAAKQPESPYDAQGRLKASAERVDWLQIPQGFERKPGMDERHPRFEAEQMRLDKVRDFFSERMLTGTVEESPARVVYRAVQPIENDPQAVPLDITLTVHGRGVSLDFTRFTYGDAKPITEDEARRQLAEERKHAE
jgi:hypothetical protein